MFLHLSRFMASRRVGALIVIMGGLLVNQAPAADYIFSHLAGAPGGRGSTDGVGDAVRFRYPEGVAVDSAGNVYVADTQNHTVRKVTPSGVTTTLAGSAGQTGSADGIGSAARFNRPSSIAVDAAGQLFVTDELNHTVRKITPAGAVSTFAGVAGQGGVVNGTTEARLYAPRGVAVDPSGNVFICDYYLVRKISPTGEVSSFAGLTGSNGSTDGAGTDARFDVPVALACDSNGNVFVADSGNHTVRKITPAGVVTTIAGKAGVLGNADGPGENARFAALSAIAVDAGGNIYVGGGANTVRKISPAGAVTTWAGQSGQWGYADGLGTAARFKHIRSLAGSAGGDVYVADTDNHVVRKISAAAAVTTFAGVATGELGTELGTGTGTRLVDPTGIVVDRAGNVFVAENQGTIRKITPTGAVSTLAGTWGQSGTTDGTGAAARLYLLGQLAIDSTDNIYAQQFFSTLRKITPAGVVTTLAAPFNGGAPAIDGSGNLYVFSNYALKKVSPAGTVTTLAGVAGQRGSTNGVGTAARFSDPTYATVSAGGIVYVLDDSALRRIDTAGNVSTVAGVAGQPGHVDGSVSVARLAAHSPLAVDAAGNVFLADIDNNTIRRVAADGTTTTIGGTVGLPGSADGVGTAAQFYGPAGIAVDANGALYISDFGNQAVRKGVLQTVQRTAPTLDWDQPSGITLGTALSAAQLNATANVSGTFAYEPASGTVLSAGTHTLTATFTPTNGDLYTTATRQVTLTVAAPRLAGSYFGTFASGGGRWALRVSADNAATFIAYLANRHSAVVVKLTLSATGTFAASSTEISASSESGRTLSPRAVGDSAPTVTASNFTLSGQINGTAVTGSLDGLGETFTGQADAAAGSLAGGYYTGPALGASTGSAYAIVAPSGQALVVTTSAPVDAATGVVGSNGQLNASTLSGGQLALKLGSQSSAVQVMLTPAGANSSVTFSGLAEGVVATTRLVNISVRSRAGFGDRTLIMGYVLSGSGSKQVLVRALGPRLTDFGVTGALADPQLKLFNATGQIDSNDDWGTGGSLGATFAALGATPLLTGSKDAALLRSSTSGLYSAHVTTSVNVTGIALAEVYDVDKAGPRLVNVSARSEAGSGDEVLVAGFVLEGTGPKTLLIRGLGPTLGALGVSGALGDPTLKIYTQTGVVFLENKDWGGATALKNAFSAVGAASLSADSSKDAAVLVTLEPGVYSAQVSGENGTTGVALVEIYELP